MRKIFKLKVYEVSSSIISAVELAQFLVTRWEGREEGRKREGGKRKV